MKLKLKNEMLAQSINFLSGIKLKGKQSRARTKFVSLLIENLKSLQESELELLRDYAELDSDGEPIRNESGQFTLKQETAKRYQEEHSKLLTEVAEVYGGTYAGHEQDCKQLLEDYDGELADKDAQAYDALLDALEDETTKKEGN